MDNFIINGEAKPIYMPEVNLNATTKECFVSGESFLEEPFKFYISILDWFKRYFQNSSDAITLNFQLTYVNSSSFRAVLDLIKGLKVYQDEGKPLIINWRYPDDEEGESVLEDGQDFADESGAHINFVEYVP